MAVLGNVSHVPLRSVPQASQKQAFISEGRRKHPTSVYTEQLELRGSQIQKRHRESGRCKKK